MCCFTATDAVVDIVLSLKVTGQHVTVPIRVQTRSAAHAGELTGGEGDYEEDSGVGGFWTNLSWLNLLLLIFLSILLIVACKFVKACALWVELIHAVFIVNVDFMPT